MLTKKGKYGLKALVFLAGLPVGESVQALDIAAAQNIPKKFLDAILVELRKNGVLWSRKGPGGGYMLGKPADQITIGQVIRILDGPLAPIRCASRNFFEPCEDCADPETCQVRRAMITVRDAMSDILDHMTLAQFVANPGLVSLPE